MIEPNESQFMKLLLTALSALALLSACASSPTEDRATNAPTPMNNGVLVIGGTGQLGSYHVKHLSDAGERVIVFARPTSSFARLEGADYEVVTGDLTDEASIMAAVMEAKPAVIIDAANVAGIRMDDGDSFYMPAMRAQITAAKAAGVTQIIRHSARGAREFLTRPPSAASGDMRSDPRIVNYMRDVARAEMILETAGQMEDSLVATIIYNRNLPPEPAAATGRGELLDDLSTDGGITRSDLARITNTCVLNADCYGRIFNGIDPALDAAQR